MDPKEIREQAIRETKISLILDAARSVFSEKGFFEARLEDIAAAAGFSKAALYTYYSDKEEIFMSLAIRDLESLSRQLQSKIDPVAPFLKNLTELMITIFSFFGENFALLLAVSNFQTSCRAVHEKMSEKHKALFAEIPGKFKKIMDQMVSLIRSAREHGEIISDINDFKLADYISALVRGIIFQWKVSGRMGDVPQETQQLIQFIANGLGCCGTTAAAGVNG